MGAESGGGYDGLHATGPNLNQGAESTLALVSTLQHDSPPGATDVVTTIGGRTVDSLPRGRQLLAGSHRDAVVDRFRPRRGGCRFRPDLVGRIRLGQDLPDLGGLPADARRSEYQMLDRLVVVADLAKEAGLDIMPTFFTGHMSGVNWIPGWAYVPPWSRARRFRSCRRARFRNENLAAGSPTPGSWPRRRPGRRTVAAMPWPGTRPVGVGLRKRELELVHPARSAAGVAVARVDGEGIRQADPRHRSRSGSTWKTSNRTATRSRRSGDVCDFLTMHGYPIYAPWASGPTDEHLLGFLTEVTRWLGGGADVLFSEFGLPDLAQGHSAPEASESILVEEARCRRLHRSWP